MAFDTLVTRRTVEELKTEIETGRITKIHQISAREMLFTIRHHRQTKKVLFSIHPVYARVQLTEADYTHLKESPMFCMLMRKHLEANIITNIEQINNDRIIKFTIVHKSEFGGEEVKYLYMEVMGKHSNFILTTAEGRIIDCMKHVPPIMNRHRTLQPSAEYILPPQSEKPSIFTLHGLDLNEIDGALTQSDEPVRLLMSMFKGCSKILATEAVHRFEKMGNFKDAWESIFAEKLNPTMITAKKDHFYAFDLQHLQGERQHFESVGGLLDAFYYGKENADRVRDHFANIGALIKNLYDRNVGKLEKLERDLIATERADGYRIQGELILANVHQISKGDKLLVAQNFYDENLAEMTIGLNERLTPAENAQAYFKRYQKQKTAVDHILHQMELTKKEVAYFEELLTYLQAADIKDVYEIQDELRELGYVKKKQQKGNKRKPEKPNVERYRTPSGIEIVVGKNNLQNNYVTHKLANRHEWWFHAKDIPGSHVLVRSDADELQEEEIRAAANLAAYFSKGRDSSSVPVDYTQIRNLRKVPGTSHGFVTYESNKTIFIDPSEADVMKLERIRG